MIHCLSRLYTARGLFLEQAGLLVARKGLLRLSAGVPLRHYANLAARLGMECAALEEPVCGESPEHALALGIDDAMAPGVFRLSLDRGGACLTAPDDSTLERGVAYLVTTFPLLPGKGQLDSIVVGLGQTLPGEVRITQIELDARAWELRSLAGLADGKPFLFEGDHFPPSGEESASTPTLEAAAPFLPYGGDLRLVWDPALEADPESALLLAMTASLNRFEAAYPLAVDRPAAGARNLLFEEGTGQVRLESDNLAFCAGAHKLPALIRAYCHNGQKVLELLEDGWPQELEKALNGENDLGQALACLAAPVAGDTLVTKGCTLAILDEAGLAAHLEETRGRPFAIQKHNDGKELRRWSFARSWEGDDFLAAFREEALPQIQPGDVITLEGLLSEDLDRRQMLEDQIRQMVEDKGASCAHAKIHRAFKPGACWIEESVLPQLEALPEPVEKIIIRFPYLVNSQGEETFEDESTPNYGRHQDKPDKYFDIPTRWLQELFPVDEVIAARLGIATDAVEFVRDDGLDKTYRLEAFGGGRLLYGDDFAVKYRPKHYMERYPAIGWAHVTTGWIKVSRNGQPLLDRRVETDPEKVWAVLEEEILPDLEALLRAQHGSGMVAAQPLFNRLQFNISMSEMDFDTGIRQERVSTPEAMQEDIYFYILDWFKTYGERELGKELDNIGLVFPDVENRKGQETAVEVILYGDLAREACLLDGENALPLPHRDASLSLSSLAFGERVSLGFTTQGNMPNLAEKAAHLQTLLDQGIVDLALPDPWEFTVTAGEETASLRWNPRPAPACPFSEEERLELLHHRVIDYPNYIKLINYYRSYKNLRIVPVETSYKGKSLYAIELIRRPAGIYSRYKLMTQRITALFNGRHHGNEATSLNSAFLLLDRLLHDPKLAELPDKINIITLPWENVDGGEMHCQIHAKNPKWLAHIARYNAAGFEFRKDYGNPQTKYGEAKALPKLWRKWLPDVVTDNHGFEGHELCQPFSGYISPWYKSFWIPRALYYGYVWFDKTQPHMEAFGSRVRDAVADAINADSPIRDWNLVCAERFQKYAERWFPTLFRTQKYKDVIFYWIDTSAQKRANNFALSHPQLTVMDWTTEVADETVIGEDLALNARAHLLSDLALLDVLMDTPLGQETGPGSKIRRRPLR